MALVLTYNSLLTNILNYCERPGDTNLLAALPTIVLTGQQRLTKDLPILLLERDVTANLAIGISTYATPTDWRQTLGFQIGIGTSGNINFPLQMRTREFCQLYADQPGVTAQPLYYDSFTQSHILISPTPDIAYPYLWSYLATPEDLDLNVQTNNITAYAPEALLYSCMIDAMTFVKDDDRIATWTTQYQDAIAKLNAEAASRKVSRFSNANKG